MIARLAPIVAVLAALGAIVAASVHANPSILAWCIALCAFAVTVAAARLARALHAPNDLSEPREARGPSPRSALPPDVKTRRSAVANLLALTGGVFGAIAIIPFVALARRRSTPGTAWTTGARLVTPAGTPLRASDLAVGSVETVFPEGHVGAPSAATLLIKLDAGDLRTTPEREGWAPQGNVAYSKICTHAGCPVAIYRKASYQLYCPCHQSVFDVLDAAKPVSGPATRALPQLGLAVDRDGYLIARGDFPEPVGPDDWWRTA